MNPEWISKFIEILPDVLIYIYPGYITLWVYHSITARKLKETNHMILKAVILSYIYISIDINISLFNEKVSQHVVLLVLSIAVGIIVNRIVKSECFEKVLTYFKIDSTPHVDVIDRIRDSENGTWLRIYLDGQGCIYDGYLRYHKLSEDGEKVIALSGYRAYTISEYKDAQYEIADYTGDNSKWIVLKYDLITRLEVIYNEEK